MNNLIKIWANEKKVRMQGLIGSMCKNKSQVHIRIMMSDYSLDRMIVLILYQVRNIPLSASSKEASGSSNSDWLNDGNQSPHASVYIRA